MNITRESRVHHRRKTQLLGTVCLMLAVPAAYAEGTVEEIVVSAQKRDESLTDTPVSVSVVGSEWVANSNLTSLEDLGAVVPGLSFFSQFVYNNTVTLRGVGTFSRNVGFDERVGLYLDGIYLGPSYGLNQNLLDLAQVEVLRGPQGTFFGRNAIAGAINLKSQKPGDELRVMGRARYGGVGERVLQGLVSTPVSDELAISLSAGLNNRDGLTDNLVTGDEIDNRNRDSMRAQAVYSRGSFEVRLSLDRTSLDERALIGDPLSETLGIAPEGFAPNDFEVAFNTTPRQSLVAKGAGLTLSYELTGGGTIQTLSGLRSTDVAMVNDTDYTPADLLHIDYDEAYNHFSQEVRYASNQNAAISYMVGVTYLDQRAKTDRHAVAGADGLMLGMLPGADLSNIGQVDTTAWGVFANADYAVTERLSLRAGLRYSHDKKVADWTINTLEGPVFGLATGTLNAERTDDDISPTFSVSYQASDDITAFVRYAEGYKSGGFNLDYVSAGIFPGDVAFEKESARSYEAGLKGSVADGTLWFSATAFWVDYDDFQVNQFRDLGGGRTAIVISNAAKVRTKGVELEVQAELAEGLSVRAWTSVLDATYSEFAEGGVGGTDVSGNKLDAPDFEAGVVVDYERSLNASLLGFVHASFTHAGGSYVTPDNITSQPLLGGASVPYGRLDARDLLDMKLGVGSDDGVWRLAIYAENILKDDAVTSSIRDFFGTITEARLQPRSYGLEASFSF
ncbi:TonB-dependent receptor [Kordiimonas sp.]|uniref:TonB-dependent receptor n=1 Tax=Kordiimonas sp. TaxID=1970157 RepID=UPI003A93EB6A